jgi:HPt (histidine-containing phosphotransfer) domain-containing protein
MGAGCGGASERILVLAWRRYRPGSAALKDFTISVHALKTASGTIGAAALSDEARQLEEAGKAGDVGLIQKNLANFCEHLQGMIKAINEHAPKISLEKNAERPRAMVEAYHGQFVALMTALADEDIGNIDQLLAELEQINFDVKAKKLLADVSDSVLMGEFVTGIKILEGSFHGK